MCYNSAGDYMIEIVTPLMEWFLNNKRDLPWRGNVSPYEIYISEIMLQQTKVEAVKPYYKRFLDTAKNFNDLATISDEALYKLWEGLGYYSRAKNLKKCAIEIVNQYNGCFPKDYEDAIKLPGIGMYTAGAILSRAYNKKIAAVDGNVLRVFSRLYLDDKDILKDTTKKYYKDKIEKIMPDNPGSFNEALMDLGATVCMPKVALCDKCPLNKLCMGYKENKIFEYPKKKSKNEKEYFEYSILYITDGNKYILLPKEDGVLKGLLSPILLDSFLTDYEIIDLVKNKYNIDISHIELIKEGKHIFSHQLWNIKAYLCYTKDLLDFDSYTKDEIINSIALPTAYKKFLPF